MLHSAAASHNLACMGKQEFAPELDFRTHPDQYRHLRLEIEGPVAWIRLDVKQDGGILDHYDLKLNSYDMSVDIELADATMRLRFEHPEVTCVVITSAQEGIFCSGANIFMLGTSSHAFKVNFCKFTNETRLHIEDATEHSGQTYIAALNGIASGGGYELPLACKEIYLVDDRRSAVALPEVPYLGVLPGTGGLTRVVDKRKVRRDRADYFCTLAEGIKGKRAQQWGLVDAVWPTSVFMEKVTARAREIAGMGRPDRKGVTLDPLGVEVSEQGLEYTHVTLKFGSDHTASLEIRGPAEIPDVPSDPAKLGCGWWPLQAFRELDDCLLRMRFNYPEISLVLIRTKGTLASVLQIDSQLMEHKDHWFINEVIHHAKRVVKRLDVTSKTFFALVEKDSCFGGSLLEVALAADRIYMLEEEGVEIALSGMNAGPMPKGNGLTRLGTRFLHQPGYAEEIGQNRDHLGAEEAEEKGLVTFIADDIDWDDEIRLGAEERASFSPDALTAMEANLRFAGPETMETKIFGRLSAWQNWIFQRPNAVGEKGALTLYGRPESPEFDRRRT
ncbi:MAG: 2,3-epoxybenzoyl-CoA dihydrolase [Planctomycetota bacterium]|nr:2,3-epoxybenzoyl-CoA dihydrolase [Planctomycetota bacterium]